MKLGNWIPISKEALLYLPKDRAFTDLEALVSLQVDYDQGSEVSVNGCASLWWWSRGKVRRFFDRVGVEILYPENTQKKQNQNGQIVLQIADRSKRKSGQIRLIDSKWSAVEADRSESGGEQKADRSQYTTIDPNPKPKKKPPKIPRKQPSSDALRLSGLLADLIADNNPSNRSIQPGKKEATIEAWSVEIDRMLRLDARPIDEAEEVICWSQSDSFWQTNIQSGVKLREQYDKLVMQMRSKSGLSAPNSSDVGTYRSYECR